MIPWQKVHLRSTRQYVEWREGSTIRKTTTMALRFAQRAVVSSAYVSVGLLDRDDPGANGELDQIGRALQTQRLQNAGLVGLRRSDGDL